jgi:hypothetical protein
MRVAVTLLSAVFGLVFAHGSASAFCGFYVGGAGAELYNDASVVVLMREGTTTVLSMQNNYQGPPKNFAMVVPVPVVLQKKQVKTLSHDLFRKVDAMAAPRLVEYWERDPCSKRKEYRFDFDSDDISGELVRPEGSMIKGKVVVHARFTAGEYDVVILGADDSSALDRWLRQHNYAIPKGAEKVLRPYVATGMKFFVAKVNVAKVKMVNGKAKLSPLRFHYESKQFNLPIRLGLLSSRGTQDLLVHILAAKRYEVANYDNVTIPTNLPLAPEAKKQFPAFYAALFDKVVAGHKGAVVTEYAWNARTCDPCPGPTLTSTDLGLLGTDVLGAAAPKGMVLTRLHARYRKGALGDDLVFREAGPIAGGREVKRGDALERGATKSSVNNFQGRYIIRYPWTGPIKCDKPVRGRWGQRPPRPATDIAAAPRGGVSVKAMLKRSLVADDVRVSAGDSSLRSSTTAGAGKSAVGPDPSLDKKRGGCAGCNGGAAGGGGALGLLVGMLLVVRRRGG